MAFHKIDMENWPRREFYQHYYGRSCLWLFHLRQYGYHIFAGCPSVSGYALAAYRDSQ